MLLKPGDVLMTLTGRAMSPFPQYNLAPRLAKRSMKKIFKWMRENAIAEATARGDELNAMIFSGLNIDSWTRADSALVGLYLQGAESGL